MKKIKTGLCALAVVVLPPILLFLSNWGYGEVYLYCSTHYNSAPLLFYRACVYTALGFGLGWLITRFEDKARRRGVWVFTGGLLLIAAFGVVYVLFRQELVDFPVWIHNIFVRFDLRELYLWGGVYLVQIICRSLPVGKMRLKPAGDAAVSYGSRGNTVAMLCVMILPALLLVVSSILSGFATFEAKAYLPTGSYIPYWNIGFYTTSGGLLGAVPWLCKAEEKRLRCAVAVTFGLSGIILLGMLYSLYWSPVAIPFAFLKFLNLNEVFLWTGLYLFLLALLLRQGYREKNSDEEV
ncbi:MAG: hypothetical protein HFI90_09475 [Clostridia bacterium]|nr:hypothetical protein [Clostridia bacterium]